MIDGIGLSLLKLLQKEYGDEYHPGHFVEEAMTAMKDVRTEGSNASV